MLTTGTIDINLTLKAWADIIISKLKNNIDELDLRDLGNLDNSILHTATKQIAEQGEIMPRGGAFGNNNSKLGNQEDKSYCLKKIVEMFVNFLLFICNLNNNYNVLFIRYIQLII